VDGKDILDRNRQLVGRIQGDEILDRNWSKVAEVRGDEILDSQWRSIGRLSEIRGRIDGAMGGASLAALWYFFIR
jgi:hypothetical protein